MNKHTTVQSRFWSKILILGPDDCWNWKGPFKSTGYGAFEVHTGIQEMSHRMTWQLTHGLIPKGMCVCHRCDNPKCCNPAHLFLDTVGGNFQDMMRKGRHAKGHKAGAKDRRFSIFSVMEIRLLCNQGGMSGAELSRLFGNTAHEMNRILRGKAYGWVEGCTRPAGPVRMFAAEQVRKVRNLRREEGLSYAEIGRRTGIESGVVRRIAVGESYAWVD